MSHYLRIRVQAVQPEYLTLELPNGTTMNWPREEGEEHLPDVAVGDELTITLTKTVDVLNELLNNHATKGETTE